MDIWSTVHHERYALADDLSEISISDWETQSLCEGWTVHDVLAHLIHDAKTTKLSFGKDMLLARLNFDRANQQGIERERCADHTDTLAAFRAAANRTTAAPAPLASRLVEVIVHGEDIRRPLGIPHAYPVEATVAALTYQITTSESMGGAKERVRDLALRATDTDFAVGTGRVVQGSALELLLVATGRPTSLEELG